MAVDEWAEAGSGPATRTARWRAALLTLDAASWAGRSIDLEAMHTPIFGIGVASRCNGTTTRARGTGWHGVREG